MATRGVVMCPVHHATLIVPFILALEIDGVADRQDLYSGSQIDIVRNQKCLAEPSFTINR